MSKSSRELSFDSMFVGVKPVTTEEKVEEKAEEKVVEVAASEQAQQPEEETTVVAAPEAEPKKRTVAEKKAADKKDGKVAKTFTISESVYADFQLLLKLNGGTASGLIEDFMRKMVEDNAELIAKIKKLRKK